jgi:hypothetical protein
VGKTGKKYGHCLDGRGKYLPRKMICPYLYLPLGCLDEVVNVDVDWRGRAGPTTNLLQFATFQG